jgi:hypothetical protein
VGTDRGWRFRRPYRTFKLVGSADSALLDWLVYGALGAGVSTLDVVVRHRRWTVVSGAMCHHPDALALDQVGSASHPRRRRCADDRRLRQPADKADPGASIDSVPMTYRRIDPIMLPDNVTGANEGGRRQKTAAPQGNLIERQKGAKNMKNWREEYEKHGRKSV